MDFSRLHYLELREFLIKNNVLFDDNTPWSEYERLSEIAFSLPNVQYTFPVLDLYRFTQRQGANLPILTPRAYLTASSEQQALYRNFFGCDDNNSQGAISIFRIFNWFGKLKPSGHPEDKYGARAVSNRSNGSSPWDKYALLQFAAEQYNREPTIEQKKYIDKLVNYCLEEEYEYPWNIFYLNNIDLIKEYLQRFNSDYDFELHIDRLIEAVFPQQNLEKIALASNEYHIFDEDGGYEESIDALVKTGNLDFIKTVLDLYNLWSDLPSTIYLTIFPNCSLIQYFREKRIKLPAPGELFRQVFKSIDLPCWKMVSDPNFWRECKFEGSEQINNSVPLEEFLLREELKARISSRLSLSFHDRIQELLNSRLFLLPELLSRSLHNSTFEFLEPQMSDKEQILTILILTYPRYPEQIHRTRIQKYIELFRTSVKMFELAVRSKAYALLDEFSVSSEVYQANFLESIRMSDLDLMKKLMEKPVDLNAGLILAIQLGRIQLAKTLIESGANNLQVAISLADKEKQQWARRAFT